MFKKLTVAGFLLLAVAFGANANDRDRIDQLEKKTQELELRLSELESLRSNPGNTQETVASSEGWKLVANWRKLATGMNASDVRKILGEPARLDGGGVAFWRYQNGGSVIFNGGKVSQWTEPRQ